MENTDDDALNWAGDDARQRGGGTWSVPQRRKGASLSSPSVAEGEPTKVLEPVETTETVASEPQQTNESQAATVGDSIALVITGILAGVYLLFAIAWLITALRDPIKIADPIGNFMFVLGLWFAVAAGPVFFASIFIAGRGRGLTFRLSLLILGAVVLVPWPYFSWAG